MGTHDWFTDLSLGCAHECGAEGTVVHADGRLLCHNCYCIETGNEADLLRPCPTCNTPLFRVGAAEADGT